jgi:hypothetical protein
MEKIREFKLETIIYKLVHHIELDPNEKLEVDRIIKGTIEK